MPGLPVKIVAVNVEGQSISASIRKTVIDVAKDLDLPFPVIIDDGLDVFYDYGVVAVPSTAVLDTSGVLRYGPAGFSLTTGDLIADSIEVLLGIKQATATTAVRMGYRPKNKASRYYNLALNLFKQRMFERALSNLELSVSDDSGFSAPHNLRGEIFLRLGQLPEALEEFALAVSLDSGSVAAWTGWGRALMRHGDVDGTYNKISAALTLDDSYTPAFLLLGLVLAEQGRTSEALDSLAKAKELNERDPDIHFYTGQVLLLADDTAQAAAAYKTALEILYPPY
jgi:tetratricopeptide (TPR) repeat protein